MATTRSSNLYYQQISCTVWSASANSHKENLHQPIRYTVWSASATSHKNNLNQPIRYTVWSASATPHKENLYQPVRYTVWSALANSHKKTHDALTAEKTLGKGTYIKNFPSELSNKTKRERHRIQ